MTQDGASLAQHPGLEMRPPRGSYVAYDPTYRDWVVMHGHMVAGHLSTREAAEKMADKLNERLAAREDQE